MTKLEYEKIQSDLTSLTNEQKMRFTYLNAKCNV